MISRSIEILREFESTVLNKNRVFKKAQQRNLLNFRNQFNFDLILSGVNFAKIKYFIIDTQVFNLSASGCCVFATFDLITWFLLTSSWLTLLKFVINSSNFLLSQNIYVSFWNFDQTNYEWMVLAARFESARFEK